MAFDSQMYVQEEEGRRAECDREVIEISENVSALDLQAHTPWETVGIKLFLFQPPVWFLLLSISSGRDEKK